MSRYMNNKLRTTLRGASKMIQAGRLMELTTAIQRSLSGGLCPADTGTPTAPHPHPSSADDVIDVEAQVVRDEGADTAGQRAQAESAAFHASRDAGANAHAASEPFVGRPERQREPGSSTPQPDGQFIAGSFSNGAGARDYKLYIPAGASSEPLPLVVMLHGCTQNPDDFAAGTAANQVADELHAYVLYPAQAQVNNMQKCWNWFQPADQARGQGEPSLIADMTRQVIARYPVDARRVYVAGLSAGGAMAATMATTYPDIYAAAGVHSGLPHGAAHDMMSAFSAMRSGPAHSASVGTVFVPTIVFHGDQDTTVHPCNGEQVIAQSKTLAPVHAAAGRPLADVPPRVEQGRVPGGHPFTRTTYPDADGATLVEHWLVHGAGHAWSGGSASGSYTDPKGPDATREMMRFFLEHPQRARH